MMFNRPSSFALAAAALLSSLSVLPGCTVGPDYHGAPPVAPDARGAAFVRTPAAGTSAEPAPREWSLAHSPDVHIAQARLRESRAQLQSQRADALPKLSANAAALRTREPDLSALSSAGSSGGSSGSSGRGPLQLYTVGFDASWEIDL